MDRNAHQPPTQTEKFILWSLILGLCVVTAAVFSKHSDESDQLAALRASEAQKEQANAALERTRVQTERYINRFTTDPEFVRDQARERLGVAESGEIVIRLEGSSVRAVQPAR
ncbi:MAG: FtsB family cell division protein [Verrucomicrobiota bacterium]